MRHSALLCSIVLTACAGGPVTHEHDGGSDSATTHDGAADLGPRDLGGGGLDLGPPPLVCDSPAGSMYTITTSPSPGVAPGAVTLVVRGPDPLANIVPEVRDASGRTLDAHWIDVDMHYRWRWSMSPTWPGDFCVTVRADPGAMVYGRGWIHIGGTAPPDAGVPDGGPPPTGVFVTRSGTELMAGSERLRFVGVNAFGLSHYQRDHSMFSGTPMSSIGGQLDAAAAIGARVVRVFAAGNYADATTIAGYLGDVLDAAAARGMWVIVVLTDFYDAHGTYPDGDQTAFTDSYMGLNLLGAPWYRSGFRNHYLPWVTTVVSRYADHPAVFAWELGNEIKCDSDHAAFLAFANETGMTIRSLDSRHLIASGMITSAWMTPSEAASFYASPYVDVITLHEYDGSTAFDESALATAAGKPWILEEAGFSSGGDRSGAVDADLRHWVDARGGRGYMQWGFVGVSDTGDGDSVFGMDRSFHSDYDALASTYSAAAVRIR